MEALITRFESYLIAEKRVSHNTFDAYKRDIAQYAGYLKNNNISLEAATIAEVKNFLQFLHERSITPRSMARKISSLKTFYSYLHQHHNFDHHARDIAMPKLEKKLPQYLSEQEIEQLLAATEKDETPLGLRNKVMVYLLYVSGMRITELVSLKKSAIHFDTGLVSVTGKGGKDRMVPLPQETLTLLRDYFENVYPRLLTQSGVVVESEFAFPIFYGKKAKHISRQAFWVILKKIVRESGLQSFVSPHKLRHSLATHLLKKGADLRSLQLLLGHEQLSTVQIYTHLETEHLRDVYDKKHPRS
jgi:site-specific recombinase XerD